MNTFTSVKLPELNAVCRVFSQYKPLVIQNVVLRNVRQTGKLDGGPRRTLLLDHFRRSWHLEALNTRFICAEPATAGLWVLGQAHDWLLSFVQFLMCAECHISKKYFSVLARGDDGVRVVRACLYLPDTVCMEFLLLLLLLTFIEHARLSLTKCLHHLLLADVPNAYHVVCTARVHD